MECIKLIASNKFHEKRIGYLGLMMLVDERQDILMLLPNSIKGDLQNPSHFIVSLALVTLANMGSVEMVRDLLPEIDRCCAHTHAFIRKKAALAAVRAIRKEPEVAEQFAPRVVALLGERPHGVVVAACALFLQVHAVAPEVLRPFYGELVPTAVRALKSLLLSSYSAQHDVSGITDPFLQVKLLQVLRILGRGNKAHSDLMSEVLAQVATNTDQRKNAGVAVLYECVQTILSIDAEPGLRVLAINLLMRFLSKNDNNTRYVALNLLHSIVSVERATVQRHKRVVVDCLKDPDISIRRRALDLSYALCDTENIRFMTTELIHYLEEADQEFKPDLTRKLCIVCERYAPSKRWQLETIVKVLARAGAYVRDDIPSSLVLLIAQSPALQADAAALLYKVVSESPLATPSVEEDERNARRDAEASESMVAAHECLIQVAVWAIGEYADLLTAGPVRVEGEDGECTALDVTTDSLLALFGHLLASPLLSAPTRAYTLTATAKLAGRVQDAAQLQRVRAMLEQFRAHPDAEIQQRACEYLEMLGVSEGTLRAPLVKRMPIPTLTNPLIRAALQDDDGEAEGEGEGEGDEAEDGEDAAPEPVAPAAPQGEGGALLEILSGAVATQAPSPEAPVDPAAPGGSLIELFAPSTPPAEASPAAAAPVAPGDPIGQLSNELAEILATAPRSMPPQPTTPVLPMAAPMGVGAPVPVMPALPTAYPPVPVYNKGGLTMTCEVAPDPMRPQVCTFRCTLSNASPVHIEHVGLQIAVPKYLRLQMQPPSGTALPPHGQGVVTQALRTMNTLHGQQPLVLRGRLETRAAGGTPSVEMFDIKGLPGM